MVHFYLVHVALPNNEGYSLPTILFGETITPDQIISKVRPIFNNPSDEDIASIEEVSEEKYNEVLKIGFTLGHVPTFGHLIVVVDNSGSETIIESDNTVCDGVEARSKFFEIISKIRKKLYAMNAAGKQWEVCEVVHENTVDFYSEKNGLMVQAKMLPIKCSRSIFIIKREMRVGGEVSSEIMGKHHLDLKSAQTEMERLANSELEDYGYDEITKADTEWFGYGICRKEGDTGTDYDPSDYYQLTIEEIKL